MAKNTIVGVSPLYDMDGNKGINIYLTRTTLDTIGQHTSKAWINGDLYETYFSEYEKNFKDLVGLECNIERNEKGKMEDFELLG